MRQSISKHSFWEIDAHGFIVNDASQNKILSEHKRSIEIVVDAYSTHLKDILHSVYLRGTVPRGLATPRISDLDTFAVVTEGETTDALPWAASVEKKIIEKTPDFTGVQFEVWLIFDITNPNNTHELPFALKTQSVCVSGTDLSDQLPKYRPNSVVANIDIVQIKNDINEAKTFLSSGTLNEDGVRYWCKRIMKNIIRSGFCLTMINEHKYTRDLIPCVQVFSHHYPDRSDEMNKALQYFLHPTCNVTEILGFLNNFGNWIVQEANAWLKQY